MAVRVLVVVGVIGAVVLPAAPTPQYDALTATQMLLHSDAAYCGDDRGHGSTHPLTQWNCRPCTASAFDNVTVEVIGVAQGGDRQAFAYVALQGPTAPTPATAALKDVVVVFRGSVLPLNYDDDEDALPVRWGSAPGALVHQGFARSYDSIAGEVAAHLRDAVGKAGAAARVYITGHSLGASQATLAAVDLQRALPQHRFEVYTFGALRSGNKAFAAIFDQAVDASWRVVHRADIVPQVVPRLLVYHHVAREVWYKDPDFGGPESLNYTVCDASGEDPTCENSVPYAQLNWHDHDWYLDHAMWCCAGAVNSSAQCDFPFPDGPRQV